MVKCINKQIEVPFKVTKRCIFAKSSLDYIFFCLITGNRISKIEHNCKYYEEEK